MATESVKWFPQVQFDANRPAPDPRDIPLALKGVSMEGTMIWFNRVKRYGFIRTDDGERLRVDESGLASTELLAERCSGTRVCFDRVGVGNDEVRAVSVRLAPSLAAGRARSRGRR
jgi:cold shock CspA family protein